MEQFVKFADSEGTEIYLTKNEVEKVNKRLEFSHTVKVFGDNASRPLYLMPKEFERGVRRYRNFGDEKSRLLDVSRFLKLESRLRALKNRSELALILLLTGCVAALWYLGGGKTPAIAYAILDFSEGGMGIYVVPAFIGAAILGIFIFATIRKRSAGFEIHEE